MLGSVSLKEQCFGLIKKLRFFYSHIASYGIPGKYLLFLTFLKNKGRKNALDLQLHEVNLTLKKLPPIFDGVCILLISDLHMEGISTTDQRLTDILINLIKPYQFDIALIAGDFRSHLFGGFKKNVLNVKKIVESIQTHYGVFAVRGNHDCFDLIAALQDIGIKMLVNSSSSIARGNDRIWIVGVDDPHLFKNADLNKAVEGIPHGDFKIALVHSPEAYIEAERAGIDLYLCGHTHGGQINIPRFGPIVKNMKAPRAFIRGLWRYKTMVGYTTAGIGVTAIPARFYCPPEITLLTLRCKMSLSKVDKKNKPLKVQ